MKLTRLRRHQATRQQHIKMLETELQVLRQQQETQKEQSIMCSISSTIEIVSGIAEQDFAFLEPSSADSG